MDLTQEQITEALAKLPITYRAIVSNAIQNKEIDLRNVQVSLVIITNYMNRLKRRDYKDPRLKVVREIHDEFDKRILVNDHKFFHWAYPPRSCFAMLALANLMEVDLSSHPATVSRLNDVKVFDVGDADGYPFVPVKDHRHRVVSGDGHETVYLGKLLAQDILIPIHAVLDEYFDGLRIEDERDTLIITLSTIDIKSDNQVKLPSLPSIEETFKTKVIRSKAHILDWMKNHEFFRTVYPTLFASA